MSFEIICEMCHSIEGTANADEFHMSPRVSATTPSPSGIPIVTNPLPAAIEHRVQDRSRKGVVSITQRR